MRSCILVIASLLAGAACDGGGAFRVTSGGTYYDNYGYGDPYYDYGYGAPPLGFYNEMNAYGYWVNDPSYGVVYMPRSPSWSYAPAQRYGNWVHQPQLGRVWAPHPQYRHDVTVRVQPRTMDRNVVIREHGRHRYH